MEVGGNDVRDKTRSQHRFGHREGEATGAVADVEEHAPLPGTDGALTKPARVAY